jgi:hypothetical protein
MNCPMDATLHITNGDSAAGIMRQAGFAGEILPWRDVLHEGRVQAHLPLPELSHIRARFIADLVDANGINRWIGGVHLSNNPWRYDPQMRTLRRSS